jgi:DNA-directed RNA polymerase beta subunit
MDKPKIIKKTLPKINIGKMPIMVKSAICVLTQNINPTITGDCAMDCGGYFIIKGSEKRLGRERRRTKYTVLTGNLPQSGRGLRKSSPSRL